MQPKFRCSRSDCEAPCSGRQLPQMKSFVSQMIRCNVVRNIFYFGTLNSSWAPIRCDLLISLPTEFRIEHKLQGLTLRFRNFSSSIHLGHAWAVWRNPSASTTQQQQHGLGLWWNWKQFKGSFCEVRQLRLERKLNILKSNSDSRFAFAV